MKASIPVHFKAYGITSNPAAETEGDDSYNRADKHPLSRTELMAYWHVIARQRGTCGALLRLHVLNGGQRIKQLLRLRASDILDDSITLHDGKGRPGRPPRAHVIPITPFAKAALFKCGPTGQFALSLLTEVGPTWPTPPPAIGPQEEHAELSVTSKPSESAPALKPS